jgi:hypothetical protein
VELDPTVLGFNVSTYNNLLKFTTIGADSCIFNKPIHNMTRFDLGTAERLDFLIDFNKANGIPDEVSNLYIIAYDQNLDDYVIKFNFTL